jgi:hypothetical protein
MPIAIPSGFRILSTDAVDARFSVADATARKALDVVNVYHGLIVFERSTNSVYKLINAAAPNLDASWLPIGSVVSVNGSGPDANGNVVASFTATYVGFSSSLDNQAPSLEASASGNITASFSNASLWIVSGETAPSRTGSNGETYIYISGSVGRWQKVPTFSFGAADARYLVRSTGGTVSGNIVLDNGAELIGTASWADNASSAVVADGVTGGTQGYIPVFGTGNSVNNSIIYQPVGTTQVGINTQTTDGYSLKVQGSASFTEGINVTGSTVLSGSLKISGSVFIDPMITSSTAITNVVMYGNDGKLYVTSSTAIGGNNNQTSVKSGQVSSFAGIPYSASVTFGAAFANTDYSVTVTGDIGRVLTVRNKETNKFIIDTNSSVAPAGTVYWIATSYNN